MKKKSKGFTLIELLAIIVILAIIAVITVPLILNIIDDAKKGTIKDSIYGYKDAINKFYVSELYKDNNSNLKLNGEYSVNDKGELSDGKNTYKIPFSGTTPTGGNLTYENNILKNGCITMDGFKATIENGEVKDIEKGTCENNPTPEEPPVAEAPTIDSCPNCVFAYYSTKTTIDEEGSTPLSNYTNDYTTLKFPNGNQATSFLGFVLNEDETIAETYSCQITSDETLCMKLYLWGYNSMKTIAHTEFTTDQCTEEYSDYGDTTKLYTCNDTNRNLSLKIYGQGPDYDNNYVTFAGCTIETFNLYYPISAHCTTGE